MPYNLKIILTTDVRKLGKSGDVLDVSEGYARNLLLKNNLARIATNELITLVRDQKNRQEKQIQAALKAAQTGLDKLAATALRFSAPGDKNGHLYAGLKESEILAKMSRGEQSLEKRLRLVDYTPIKTAGDHEATVEISGIGSKKIKISITTS